MRSRGPPGFENFGCAQLDTRIKYNFRQGLFTLPEQLAKNININLNIKLELNIASKSGKHHRVAHEISDFFVQKIFFDFLKDFRTFSRKHIISFKLNLRMK